MKNRNSILAVLFVLIAGIGMCLTSGCEKWQLTTVSYEGVGEVLNSVRDEAQSLCADGVLDPNVCEQIKAGYNKARGIYIEAGKVLVDAMKLEDAAQKALKLKQYRALIDSIPPAIRDMIALLEASGANLEKIDAIVKKYSVLDPPLGEIYRG